METTFYVVGGKWKTTDKEVAYAKARSGPLQAVIVGTAEELLKLQIDVTLLPEAQELVQQTTH